MSVNARKQLEDGLGGVFLSLGASLYQFTQNRWRRPFRALFVGSQVFVPYTLRKYFVRSKIVCQSTRGYDALVFKLGSRRWPGANAVKYLYDLVSSQIIVIRSHSSKKENKGV